MKTALCLSGQPRCIEKCIDSLMKYIVEPLNCDIFIHFWLLSTVYDHFIKDWYKSENVRTWKPFTDEHALKHLNILKPRVFIIQPQSIFDMSKYKDFAISESNRLQTIAIPHVFSMYYSIFTSNGLKKYWEYTNGFKYDCVIKCRSDLKFNQNIPNKCFDDLNKIYVPFEGYGGINDQFAISNSNNMDIYANCFNCIDTYFDNGCDFGPEKLLQRHLNSNNLKTEAINVIYSLER